MNDWERAKAEELLKEADTIKGPDDLPDWNIKAEAFLTFVAIRQMAGGEVEP